MSKRKNNKESVNNVVVNEQIVPQVEEMTPQQMAEMGFIAQEEVEESEDELLGGIIDYKSFSKAMRDVLKETRSLNQSLKVFGGLLKMPLTIKGNTYTFGELLEMTAPGSIVRGKINPKRFINAWVVKNEVGAPMVYRNIAGRKIDEDRTDKGRKHDDLRVYTYDSKGNKYVPVSKYAPAVIDDYRWSAMLILKGLAQNAFPKHFENEARKSEAKWEAVTEVFRFQSRTEKGSVLNAAMPVKKSDVEFGF